MSSSKLVNRLGRVTTILPVSLFMKGKKKTLLLKKERIKTMNPIIASALNGADVTSTRSNYDCK